MDIDFKMCYAPINSCNDSAIANVYQTGQLLFYGIKEIETDDVFMLYNVNWDSSPHIQCSQQRNR